MNPVVLQRKQDACLQVLPRGIARLDAVQLVGDNHDRRHATLAVGVRRLQG